MPPAAASSPPRKPRTPSWRRVLWTTVAALTAVLIFIASWDLINVSRAAKSTFGSGNILSLLTSASLKNTNGRTNILIAGYSADDAGHSGATLTDSLMLVSLDTKTKTGYMLSVPRDLYVKIPGFDYGKINEVYNDGGMNLLEQVVSNDFGVPINYYALVNYAAVRDSVNALGGISINIHSSDPRGIYDSSLDYQSATCCALAKYPNGQVNLSGQQALNLSRARGEGLGSYGLYSDFDRTGYQREIFQAIKDKISWTLILNPLKNGKLFSAVGHNVKTNITLRETRPLFGLFKRVPNAQLKSYSLRDLNGKNYLVSTAYEGSTLSPATGSDDFSQIQAALAELNK